MYTRNLPMHLVRALAPPRVAAGILVTLALLSAACSNDPASHIMSPSMSSINGSSGASSFTVLANQAVTCTDGKITGDVGTFQALPTGSVTRTSCAMTGTVHVGDAAAVQAYNSFVNTYNALAPVPGAECPNNLSGTLAGVTLSPGVYCFDAAATLTGVLTLDGNGDANAVWTFKIGASGTGALTGTNFTVVMAGGGQACNVTWWVAQAVTMTDSHFLGTILAGAAITLTRGTFGGNAYAGASGVGDVTITGTTVTGCAGSGGRDDDHDKDKSKCNQGVGNGPEGCDPGNSNHNHGSNDENGGTPGHPGRRGDR